MRRLFVGAVLALGLGLTFGPAASAADGDVETFGDWGYKCEPGQEEGTQLCYMFQNVTKKDSGQMVLGARIAYRPDKSDPLLVLTVPLGSLLPPGAALVMDGVAPLELSYFLCSQEGCTTVATPIPPALVAAMKKGERAVIRVAAPNNEVIGLPLSLMGFTKAINTLPK
jgi:invasion protein IalB